MQHFNRRETVILTRTSPGRLAYLAKTGIMVPQYRDDDDHARQIYYSWEQILELRAIRRLRRQVSLQMIRKVLMFLEAVGSDRALHNKSLVIVNGEVAWVQTTDSSAPQVVQVAAKSNQHIGQLQLMPLPQLEIATGQARTSASHSNVIDLEQFRQHIPTLR